MIEARCLHADGTLYVQECATADVARACVRAFRADPTVTFGTAFYTRDLHTIDSFRR